MGYELKRLMGQYGVSTPSMANYSGASAPGTPPAAGAAQADRDAFDESARRYNVDTNAYNTYKKEYEDRLQNSPGLYSQGQFNTASNTPSTAYSYSPMAQRVNAPGGGGIDQANRDIQNWFAGNPNATPADRATIQQKYGVSERDIRNAMGSGFNPDRGMVAPVMPRAPLTAPVYTPAPVSPGTVRDFAMRNPDGTMLTGGGPEADESWSPENAEFWAYNRGEYARGGAVKTHYQTAGQVVLPGGYVEEEDTMPPAVTAVTAAPNNRRAELESMLASYGPAESAYAEELKTSRERAQQESEAFASMLSGAMTSPENENSSKAELYFRLASAFGAPTKTGQFSESLGMAGKEMSEYSKDKRASSQDKLNLALKAQELKMGAAKEDLNTLRSLASEEMRDKRAIGTEMIKEYVASGKPQSNAGKQAQDEGLQIGTPEFNARVQELSQIDIDKQIQMTQLQLDNLSLRSENQSRLSPTEIALKTKTEDNVGSLTTALDSLSKAYALNPNSLAGGWLGKGQQFLGEISGSDDPVYVNTRQINNLLGAQALELLRATFGGSPTEGERSILLELQGIGSATKEDRAKIMMRAYTEIQKSLAREQNRLEQINSGAYRMTNPPATIDGGVQ